MGHDDAKQLISGDNYALIALERRYSAGQATIHAMSTAEVRCYRSSEQSVSSSTTLQLPLVLQISQALSALSLHGKPVARYAYRAQAVPC